MLRQVQRWAIFFVNVVRVFARRFRPSPSLPALLFLIMGVLVLGLSATGQTTQVCERPLQGEYANCRTYQVVAGSVLRLMAFTDQREGFFTVVLTLALAVVAGLQLTLLRRQDRMLDRQFVASFRPRLTIRAVRLEAGANGQGEPIGEMTYVVSNIGGRMRTSSIGRLLWAL